MCSCTFPRCSFSSGKIAIFKRRLELYCTNGKLKMLQRELIPILDFNIYFLFFTREHFVLAESTNDFFVAVLLGAFFRLIKSAVL